MFSRSYNYWYLSFFLNNILLRLDSTLILKIAVAFNWKLEGEIIFSIVRTVKDFYWGASIASIKKLRNDYFKMPCSLCDVEEIFCVTIPTMLPN